MPLMLICMMIRLVSSEGVFCVLLLFVCVNDLLCCTDLCGVSCGGAVGGAL